MPLYISLLNPHPDRVVLFKLNSLFKAESVFDRFKMPYLTYLGALRLQVDLLSSPVSETLNFGSTMSGPLVGLRITNAPRLHDDPPKSQILRFTSLCSISVRGNFRTG